MTKESQETKIAVIQRDIGYMKDGFDDFKNKLDDVDKKLSGSYVSKDEFEPVKKIVYGLVGLILIAVVGAVISLVVRGS